MIRSSAAPPPSESGLNGDDLPAHGDRRRHRCRRRHAAAGGLIGLPTETVYGLGADATNEAAVQRIFATKGRPAGHPLIVHVHGPAGRRVGRRGSDARAAALAEAFWPGPLTIIVESSGLAAPSVTGGRTTVGLRVPDHPVALEVLRRFGGGVAAPSANRFGHVSPTTADHVRADLGDAVDVILDGGPSRSGSPPSSNWSAERRWCCCGRVGCRSRRSKRCSANRWSMVAR
ncbi:MAG: L-threonylcarbamoyladenylate synthase [Acidimicrobiales bacterium]